MGLTLQQLQERRTMITATDTVTLAGEGYKDRSALDVYMEKIAEGPVEEQLAKNTAMRVGAHMEPFALQLLAEEKNLTLRPGKTERHPEYSYLGATPDADVMRNADAPAAPEAMVRVAVAEAKAVGLYVANRWGITPPDRVVIQVMKQMIVAQVKLAHVVALVATEPRFYVVEYEPTLAEALVDLDRGFWTNHVLPRKPPAPEATEAAGRALRQLYPRVKGDVFKASSTVEGVARAYFEAKAAADQAAELLVLQENSLKAIIGDRKGVEGDGWIATWGEVKGRVSWKNVAEQLLPKYPDTDVEQYREPPGRRFVCKATTGTKEDE